MEIAVIGNDDFVTGFQLAGVRNTFAVEKNIDEKILDVLDNNEIGILVLEEKDFDGLKHKTKTMLEKRITPVVITLSSEGKETDLKEMIKRSVGVDLWK